MNFIWYILIGIIAGYLAGLLMRGKGFGLLLNLLLGIVGGVLGGWLFGVLRINIGVSGLTGSLITALAGSVVLLFVVSLFRKR